MDESEAKTYIIQIIALFVIYIFCMMIVVINNPVSGEMICDKKYGCDVSITYVWNIKQNGFFSITPKAKMKFCGHGYDLYSGFLNIYGNGYDIDPFGTTNFYPYKFADWNTKDSTLLAERKNFEHYLENPKERYILKKEYPRYGIMLWGGIITAIFMVLALARRPINTILQVLDILLTRRRY